MRRGQCCSRSELLRDVWQMSPDAGTNVVDVYVNYLRRKLTVTDAGGELGASLIETVRGEGYRISVGRKTVARVGVHSASVAFAGA